MAPEARAAVKDLHYVGLTAVCIFLALATGLVLGSALGSPGARDRVYEGLRRQFEELGAENRRVRDENAGVRRWIDARDQALREMLPEVLQGRLPGSTVAVFICGHWDERRFWGDLEGAFRSAGARIGPVVRIPDRLSRLEPSRRARFEAIWGADAMSREEDEFAAVEWLVRAMARGHSSIRVEELARAAGIELRGYDGEPVSRLLVLVSVPDEDRARSVLSGQVPEARIVETARGDSGIRVVAAEPESADPSAVEALRQRGVPTVDNVDTPAGQLSVVLALAGAEGSFGSKLGAARAIPPLERR